MHTAKFFICICTASLFLLYGCSNQSESHKSDPSKTLRLNFQSGDVESLHPHRLQGPIRCYTLGTALFERLTYIDEDGKTQLGGAASVDVSNDQLRYTFTLRDNFWSDGTPVTAYQYESAWKAALKPSSECTRANLFYVIKNAEAAKKGELSIDEVCVTALDEKHLFVELDFPAPYFLPLLSQTIFAPLVDVAAEPTVFNGPFQVKTWKREDLLVLVKNETFWDKEHIALDQIHISMIKDADTALALYDNHELDWIGDPFTTLSNEFLSTDRFQELQQRAVERPYWTYINTSHHHLSSPKIRKALSLALDRNTIAEHLFMGDAPLLTPLSPGFTSLEPDNHILYERKAEARALFDEGLQELGLTRETYPPILMSYSANEMQRRLVAEYFQQTWQNVLDIKVDIVGIEWNIFYTNMQRGDFEIGGCYCSPAYPDGTELLERIESPASLSNFPNWNNPLFQEKLDLARHSSVPEIRRAHLAAAEALIKEEAPIIALINHNLTFGTAPNFKHFALDHAGSIDFRTARFE